MKFQWPYFQLIIIINTIKKDTLYNKYIESLYRDFKSPGGRYLQLTVHLPQLWIIRGGYVNPILINIHVSLTTHYYQYKYHALAHLRAMYVCVHMCKQIPSHVYLYTQVDIYILFYKPGSISRATSP